jgi:hypothetical protein
MVACQLAMLVLKNDHCLASQHLKGKLNVVANFLSFNGSSQEKSHPLAYDCPPDSIITQRFHKYFHKQIPENFVISPLPSKILSWIAVILQTHESYVMADKKAPTNQKIAVGGDGSVSAPKQVSTQTPSSLLYPSAKLTSLQSPSSPATAQLTGLNMVKLQAIVNDQCLQALCAATSYVALLFQKRFQHSPFHIQDHKVLRPSVKQLLNAFENLDPPPNRQKAITPKFLRVFHQLSGAGSPDTRDTAPAVAATLLILAFFFAMRSCEHTTTPNPGRTKKKKLKCA